MQYFHFLFGAITLAAAIQGGLAGSKISLIAGGILGALVIAGGALSNSHSTLALILALVGSLGVTGKFLPDFLKKGYAIWPAGVLAALGVISVILTVVGLIRK
jgi:uncharacterized membrane protein (UPF0136 family)